MALHAESIFMTQQGRQVNPLLGLFSCFNLLQARTQVSCLHLLYRLLYRALVMLLQCNAKAVASVNWMKVINQACQDTEGAY